MSLLNQLKDTLPAFIHSLPEKNKPARWLPQQQALQCERIRLHGNNRHFLMVDYDVKNGNPVVFHEHYDIEPNFITYNPINLNHQAFWRIANAVHCQDGAKYRKPYLFLRAIERAYDDKYNCDKHFARYISRNPLHAFADTDWRHDRQHTLNELAEVVNLNQRRIIISGERKPKGAGRNREVFDDLRHWAYKQEKCDNFNAWFNKLLIKAISYNTYSKPMDLKEVEQIAKSVAQYTFNRTFNESFTDYIARTHTSEIQAKRGAIGGKVSKGGGRPPLGKPWEVMGISRATYFRRKKNGTL
jgi:hypothetical protein